MSSTMRYGEGTPVARAEEQIGTSPLIRRPLDLTGRAVLLATDGSPCAVAAARVAHGLATQYHALVHVVSVVDTRSAPMPPPLDMAVAFGDAIVGTEVDRRDGVTIDDGERLDRAPGGEAIAHAVDLDHRMRTR